MFVAVLAFSMLGAQFKDASATPPKWLLKSVYYVPFRLQTYVPVTKENIESSGRNVADRLRTKEATLSRILRPQGKAAKIDPKRIRLKVTTAKGEIYMDANFVAMSGGKQFKLTATNRAVIDALFYEDWFARPPR